MVLNRRDGLKSKLDWRYWPSSPSTATSHASSTFSEHARHLELEDHKKIDWGLAQCEDTPEDTAVVDVLDVVGTDVTWKSGVADDELKKTVSVGRLLLASMSLLQSS